MGATSDEAGSRGDEEGDGGDGEGGDGGTLVSQLTADRLGCVQRLAIAYAGPISLALFVRDPERDVARLPALHALDVRRLRRVPLAVLLEGERAARLAAALLEGAGVGETPAALAVRGAYVTRSGRAFFFQW